MSTAFLKAPASAVENVGGLTIGAVEQGRGGAEGAHLGFGRGAGGHHRGEETGPAQAGKPASRIVSMNLWCSASLHPGSFAISSMLSSG